MSLEDLTTKIVKTVCLIAVILSLIGTILASGVLLLVALELILASATLLILQMIWDD